MNERTGIKLIEDEEERAALSFAIELRNIYTHNRGVVNETFLRRLKALKHGFSIVKGTRFHADFDTIVNLTNNMASIAKRLDQCVAAKFKVRQKAYETWRRKLGGSSDAQPTVEPASTPNAGAGTSTRLDHLKPLRTP
jgi:hypothetical protein